MCGIAGFLNREHTSDKSVLDAMLDSIEHRGPDDRGLWAHGPVGLAHVRLSILDLSKRGHQPFITDDQQGIIIYNGEVYNFHALRNQLEKAGFRFKSNSDTELVLYALHHWGPEQAVKLFNGMFAFAYYDVRSNTLWLGRDRLGIKPLYITRTNNGIVFGSEIKALLAHPDVQPRPDMHAIITQIIYERLDGSWTLFENIESILPGTLVRINVTEQQQITYFDVLRDIEPRRILEGRGTNYSTVFQQFEKHFNASVQQHLISDAPLATLCSGGLDSSLVTALARDHKQDIVAYVADIEGMHGEEVRRARSVCHYLDITLRPVPVSLDTYCRLWPQAILANDQPNYFAQNTAAMAVAEAMQGDGFKAVLTGHGADELFGGYTWYEDVYKMWRKRRLHAKWIHNNAFFRYLAKLNPLLSPLDLESLSNRPFTHLHQHDASGLMGPAISAVDGAKRHIRSAALFKRVEILPKHEERAFLAMSYEDIYTHLAEALCTNDKMAMWYSVEARFPFLDNTLIDFGLHLPFHAKYLGGARKRLIMTLATKRLPREIVQLPKIGFWAPSSLWQCMAGFLRNGEVASMLKWRAQDQDVILNMIQRYPRFLYRLISTEIWARMYFDGQTPKQMTEMLLHHRQNRN
jgi:asparagine synthase (glutamine-hydrolysing)